ncbi:MAG: hypothetical protein QOH93_2045, partial [Chloroflexia bacterium]|nr:hypothetical protein [Chloroflexia bacterium]
VLDGALATFRAIEDSWGIEQTLINLGIADYLRGEYPQSSERFKECLLRKLGKRQSHLHHTYDDKRSMARCFAELGSIAHKQGRPVRAALLLGVANAIRKELGVKHARGDLSEYRKTTRELREALGKTGRMALFIAGDAMPLDQAVAYVTLDSFVSWTPKEYEGFEEHIEQFLCAVAGILGLRAVAFTIRTYRDKPCRLLVYALGDFDQLRASGSGLESESYKTHAAITKAYSTLRRAIRSQIHGVSCSLWFVDTTGEQILEVLRNLKEKLVDDVSDIVPEFKEEPLNSQDNEEMFTVALTR